jgi:hypothetical protein
MEEIELDLDKVDQAFDIASEEFELLELSNAEVFHTIALMLAHLIKETAVDKNPETSLNLLREILSIELQEKLDS